MANVFVCKPFDWISKLRFNNGFASEIESIKHRARDIAERHQRYRYKFNHIPEAAGSNSVVVNSLAYDRRGDALLVEETELVGIENRKNELMGWLVEGGSRFCVISVAGMGGLGKTTLVKKLYDDPAVKKHFQIHAWITVSQLFKIDELLKDTIQQLFDEIKQAVPQGMSTMNINQLKEVIKQFLQERRYVLVFDDVWSTPAWDAIKYALPNNSYGSRVIITTRLTDVASHASTGTVGNPPKGMGALTSLHQLSFVDATLGTGILKELGKMKELRRLCILKLRTDDGMALCSSIENLHNLRVLGISSSAEDEILDLHYMSYPPLFMQRLYLTGRLAKFPHWIQSLRSLVKVYFKWSQLLDDPLKYLQDLPNLVHLEFLVGYIGEELRFKAGKFQRLRLLDLDKLEPLREVIVEDGAMPHLEKLIIQRCNFLESVPTGIECLTNIKVLEFFDMPDEFIVKLREDHHKVAHIPQVYYTYWRDGGWEAYTLEGEQEKEKFGRPTTAIRTYDQRNSL
ncbi:Disease resistance protein RPM1 [Forsythia ovata]|uniref:Disease resistance protein RPM1 n=1 Tax=Forsythia ovata TaxID=205694 RepID=A0ABD1R331_9LAMI